MTDPYTGKAQDKRYTGDDIDVTFNANRCIHAAYCVSRLPNVWDTQKRPWVNADVAPADEIAAVVHLCPSGALHYERKDGGDPEPTPETNRIILWENGPLQIQGDFTLRGAAVDIADETRATLCRCGASGQKPFCDNTHKQTDIQAGSAAVAKVSEDAATGGKMDITVNANGPLGIEGNFTIENENGDVIFTGSKTWLCRCGNSRSKPFCDGTHNNIDFQAE